jgi:predicted AlkP superfamily pyrophosphatase or phosphodiesterase
MYLPDYQKNSIVNLMSSIAHSLGGESPYNFLPTLPPAELSACKNIILWVIDGLGYEYLLKYGQNSIFNQYLRGPITSVFPSTTAAAITTFATGVAPQQHAITGWFVHLKELGTVSAILPFRPRYGGLPFSQHHIKPNRIYRLNPLSNNLKVKSYAVMPKELVTSDYNQTAAGPTRLVPYRNLRDFFKTLAKIIRADNRPKYINAYWGEFDALSHHYGNHSQQAADHFRQLNNGLASFIKTLDNSDTTLIITADHGFIDADESRFIYLEDHPHLQETLTLPLCGEGRNAYAYVRPAKTSQFEAYIAEHLSDKIDLHRGEELIARGYFGLFEPNPRLFERIGDYVLVMKDNYIIRDVVLGEYKHVHLGHHGGVSQDEMLTPLVVIKK